MKKKMAKWKAQSLSDKLFDIIIYTILFLFAAACLYPLYYIVLVSFSSEPLGVYFWPKNFTTKAYGLVIGDKELWSGYLNTIIYTVGGVLFSLALTVPCAYTLSRKDVPGRKLITGYLLVTMFVGGGMIPTYLTVQKLHLVNTWWVVIILTGVSAYNVIVARTFFATSIPDELLDASRVDGCGNGKFMLQVVLPLSKPILAVLALWIGVGRWNSYFTEMVYLRDREKYTVSLYLRKVLWQVEALKALAAGTVQNASAVEISAETMELAKLADVMQYVIIIIASAPLLVVYPFIQKYFAKGVMIGSVKG